MRFRRNAYYIDTETCGFHGLATLIQYAYQDSKPVLHNLWDVPVKDTLELIEKFCEKTCVFFNASYDWFHLAKIYTMWKLLPPNAIPSKLSMKVLTEAERDGRDGPCIKPKDVMDLMLHSRKGEFQTLMSRHDVKVTKVPTPLAEPLRNILEGLIELDGILFAKRANPNAPKWGVYDRIKKGKEDQVDPNFKDVVLKFKPARGLKYLAQHCLGLDPEFHSFKDVYPERPGKLFELGYAPFALAVSSAEEEWKVYDKNHKLKGHAWPEYIHLDIEHWRENEEARRYGRDDVIYTRLLDEYFGFPESGDNDSVLACMVAAVRWHGFVVDTTEVTKLLRKSSEVLEASPVNINKPAQVKRYIREVMDESEAIAGAKSIDKSTKKANLEHIRTEFVVSREDLDPELIDLPCTDCGGDGVCPRCGGSGIDPDPREDAEGPGCVACLPKNEHDKGTGECARCVGSGREPGAEMCVRCLGEGQEGEADCPRCQGKGYLLMGPMLASERADEILKCKVAAKEVELYAKLLKAGRFHAAFKVIGTLSSRMAGGEGLNAQGIKGSDEVRGAFPLMWDGMVLCGGDFDGFEVTIADAVFGDPKLRESLLAGVSIHTMMAEKIYPEFTRAQIKASKGFKDGGDIDMYTRGKQAVFATLYGGDANTINKKLGIAKKVAEAAFDAFQNEYPGIKETREKIAEDFEALKQHGDVGTGHITYKAPAEYIETFLGFRRYFTLENKIAKAIYDLAHNTPRAWRKLNWKVVRRDREQTPAGAISSALYGAAFQIQASTIRAANNHLIQSPGAVITKELQRKIWDLQPHGVNDWKVAPMNVHDEVLSVTAPDMVDAVTAVVVECVESFRDRVPLIGMSWVKSMMNWAGKKGGGEDLEVNITPAGIEGFDVGDLEEAVNSLRDDCYIEPMDMEELEDLDEQDDPCPEMNSLEEYI
jgi:hypothetical protein